MLYDDTSTIIISKNKPSGKSSNTKYKCRGISKCHGCTISKCHGSTTSTKCQQSHPSLHTKRPRGMHCGYKKQH